MRLDRSQSGWSTCETDGGDKCAESEIGQGLLRRWRECSHCGAPRAKPAADQSGDQCATAAAKGKGDGAYRKTEQSDQQSNRQTTGEICNVGPVVGTEGLPNLPFQRPDRHCISRRWSGGWIVGRIAQFYGRPRPPYPWRRRWRIGRRTDQRLVSLAAPHNGSIPANGATIPVRSRTGRIYRLHRSRKWTSRFGCDPSAWATVTRNRYGRYLDAVGYRHPVCASRIRHEPGDRLRRSRWRNDCRCRRDGIVRSRREPDPSSRRGRAVRYRQRRVDGARTDYCRTYFCCVSVLFADYQGRNGLRRKPYQDRTAYTEGRGSGRHRIRASADNYIRPSASFSSR